jgi:transcription elongation factor Elf1
MNHIDLKYSGILSTRLDRFSIKSNNPYKANMRCPICGDSQKSKTKARGWILEKDNRALYYCHNCSASLSLGNFLRAVDNNLYNDYVADTLLEKKLFQKDEPRPLDSLVKKRPKFQKGNSPLLRIKKVSSLQPDHPVKKYVEKRKIPTSQHYKLYYAPKFNKWVNSIIPRKLNEKYDEPRLITPFIDEKGNLFGFAGRSFDPKAELRYITIMIDEDRHKIFGLDAIDFNKKYYVTEGQFDSMFLPNALAMAGADGNNNGLRNTENAVFVFDNEPRNKEIVARMEKVLSRGDKVVIWPSNLEQKDINDMVLAGIKPVDIQMIIDNNTYYGLEGKLALTIWKRV